MWWSRCSEFCRAAVKTSARSMLGLSQEPLSDQVEIGDNAVIMMGAIINIGAEIGTGTMIDMEPKKIRRLGEAELLLKNSHGCAGLFLPVLLSQPVLSQFAWGTMS